MIKLLLLMMMTPTIMESSFELLPGVSSRIPFVESHNSSEARVFDAMDSDHQAKIRWIISHKPFFRSAVPGSEELFLTFFEDFYKKANLDWEKTGLDPSNLSNYHPVRMEEFGSSLKATCDRFFLKDEGSLSLCVSVIHDHALYMLYEEEVALDKPKEEVFEHMGSLIRVQ